jgi:hypothetical protein
MHVRTIPAMHVTVGDNHFDRGAGPTKGAKKTYGSRLTAANPINCFVLRPASV